MWKSFNYTASDDREYYVEVDGITEDGETVVYKIFVLDETDECVYDGDGNGASLDQLESDVLDDIVEECYNKDFTEEVYD